MTRRESKLIKSALGAVLGIAMLALVLSVQVDDRRESDLNPAALGKGPLTKSPTLVRQADKVTKAEMRALQKRFGHLPLHFEQNRGQTDPDVKYLSRNNGFALFLTSSEAVISLHKKRSAATKQGLTF